MNYIFAGGRKRGRPRKGDAGTETDLQEWLDGARPNQYEWQEGKLKCLVCDPPSIFTIFRRSSPHDILLHEKQSKRHGRCQLMLQRQEVSRSSWSRCAGWHPEIVSLLPPGQISLSQAAWVQPSHPNASHRIYHRVVFLHSSNLFYLLFKSRAYPVFSSVNKGTLLEHLHCVCNISQAQEIDAIAVYAEEGCPGQTGHSRYCGFDEQGLFVRSPECTHNGELTYDTAKSECCDQCIAFVISKTTRSQILAWAIKLHRLAYAEYRVKGEGAVEFLAKWKAMDYVSGGTPDIAALIGFTERQSTQVLVSEVASACVCVCAMGGDTPHQQLISHMICMTSAYIRYNALHAHTNIIRS